MAKKAIISQTPPNTQGIAFPEFSKKEYDANVWKYGYECIVEQAIRCPHNYKEGESTISCQNCFGTGWVFVNPRKTKLLSTSINTETKQKQWSEERLGTVSVTTAESERFSFMDRITVLNNSRINNAVKFSEVKQVRTNAEGNFVFLSYAPTEIIAVHVHNGDSNKLVKLNEDLYSINPNNPYVLNINNSFANYDFNGVVSVLYEHELQYHVLDIPHDLRNSYIVNNNGRNEQILLPVNAIARRTHNVFDTDNYDANKLLNNDWLVIDEEILIQNRLKINNTDTDFLSTTNDNHLGIK